MNISDLDSVVYDSYERYGTQYKTELDTEAESFDVLRTSLFEQAAKFDAWEAAHDLLYHQTRGMPFTLKKEDGPRERMSASDYQALASCEDFLLWKTLQQTALFERDDTWILPVIARMAMNDLPAFHEAVGNWGTKISEYFVDVLAKDQGYKSGASFKGYVGHILPQVNQVFGQNLRGRADLLGVADHVLEAFAMEGWHLEPVESWTEFERDYATYCAGFNGFPSWGNSQKDQEVRDQEAMHIIRASYEGTKLFWIWLSTTYKRLRWTERVITDESRSLKRSLGGKIGIARRDAHVLEELEY